MSVGAVAVEGSRWRKVVPLGEPLLTAARPLSLR